MKAKVFLFILLSVALKSFGQDRQEGIELHLNTTFLLTGEKLLISAYCFDKASGKPSTLSSVAYVEIIGIDRKPVVQMKLQLSHGIGNGDVVFTADVPTANYTIIAYTKWMRNFDHGNFFSTNLTIINPDIRPSVIHQSSEERIQNEFIETARLPAGLMVRLDQSTYKRRQRVRVEVKNSSVAPTWLSLSVRSVDPEITTGEPWKKMVAGTSSDTMRFLPDFRSEWLSGRITRKDGNPLAGQLVTLSSPSEDFVFLISKTDRDGRYYFAPRHVRTKFLLFGVQDRAAGDFVIRHEDGFLTKYERFTPPEFTFNNNFLKLVSRRNLSLQVENAFYAARKDSVPEIKRKPLFFVNPDKSYKLDDFTRFPTMEDIFREIIPEVVVKVRDGNFSVVLTNSTTGFRFGKPPLVLVDGVPVSDANQLMKYDPSLVRSIGLITQRYYYGGLECEGIISIETFRGDAGLLPTDHLVQLDYVPVDLSTLFYSPKYDGSDDLSRIPDFRTQLYWNPHVRVHPASEETLSFFTGDLPGWYMIEITGLNADGEKIYLRSQFEVRD